MSTVNCHEAIPIRFSDNELLIFYLTKADFVSCGFVYIYLFIEDVICLRMCVIIRHFCRSRTCGLVMKAPVVLVVVIVLCHSIKAGGFTPRETQTRKVLFLSKLYRFVYRY